MTGEDAQDTAKGEGELIIYRTGDGTDVLQLGLVDGTVWLIQAEIATLFETSKQNVSYHIREVLAEGELATNRFVAFNERGVHQGADP